MTKQPISIILLTYNRIKYLKAFIESLYFSTDYPFELTVIDNGSIDGSRFLIMKLANNGLIYQWQFNKENLPLAAAYTNCLNEFKDNLKEFIITCPDDIMPPLFKEFDWLELFIAKIKSDKNIGSINFVGTRCSFNSFSRKVKPMMYARAEKEGGKKFELYKRLQKLLYSKYEQ